MLKKSLMIAIFILLWAHLTNAQVPQFINYQGLLTDAAGNPIDGSRTIQFKIYPTETGGSEEWSETHAVSVSKSLFSVLLGSMTPIPYSVFDGNDKYLSLKVENDPEMTPRKRLVSVGYAFRTYEADKLDGKDASAFVQKDEASAISTEMIQDDAVTTTKISPNVISSLNGVSNDGGNIDLVAGNNVTITPDDADNQITISATTTGGGDNLGNHTATQNINLNGHWLSGDSDSEGIYVKDDGNVGIGTTNPTAQFHVSGINGAVFEGTYGSGTIPKEGPGTRMMWYPAKAALRVGHLDLPNGNIWDADSIGKFSIAMGQNPIATALNSIAIGASVRAAGENSTAIGVASIASGFSSTTFGWYTKAKGLHATAMGIQTEANGDKATAMGCETIASGEYSSTMGLRTQASGGAATALGSETSASGNCSIAMGAGSIASGDYSSAMGRHTVASGNHSTALGYETRALGPYSFAAGTYAKANHDGCFVWSDFSGFSNADSISSTDRNQFMVRASGGVYLYSNRSASIGVRLDPGASSWSSISDSSKKENFKPVISEEVLQKVSQFKLGTWNYKGQDPTKYRHYGPMAQDFFTAFGNDGIGTIGDDITLSSADFDGINFIAIHALEKRTTVLRNQIADLRMENEQLKTEINQMKRLITGLNESMLKLQSQFTWQNEIQSDVEIAELPK